MPLYDVWRRTGGPTKPVERRWTRVGQVELPYPYWNAFEQLTAGLSEEDKRDFHRYGRLSSGAVTPQGQEYLQEAARAGLREALGPDPRYAQWPEVHGALLKLFGRLDHVEAARAWLVSGTWGHGGTITYATFYTRENTRRARRHEYRITPPMNVLYDLRTLPNGGTEWGAPKDEFDTNGSPYVLGLPGMVAATGRVVQGWPWQVDWDFSMSEVPIPEVQVAVDAGIERGLAGFAGPIGTIAYDLTDEADATVEGVQFYLPDYVTGEHRPPDVIPMAGAEVEEVKLIAAGHRYDGVMLVHFVIKYRLGHVGNSWYFNRSVPLQDLLEGRPITFVEDVPGLGHNIHFTVTPHPGTPERLLVWVDDQLERGNWRMGPDGVWKTGEQLRGLSASLVRKKNQRRAVVKETKQPLRDGAMPNENVIGFKMPSGYQILTRSGSAETYYLYAFDTEANANAYHDAVVAGTKKLFQFPARSYGRQNPITDIWAKWNKPPKGCISVFFIGVYEDNGERIMFVDMMSTKPEWQRYGVNTAMLLYLQMRWPGHRLLFSDTTHAGHAYAEWWRAQGREVEEQNAAFWKRYKGARVLP